MPDSGRSAFEPSARADGSKRGGVGRAILVVDDDIAVRDFVADALRRSGHEVLPAASGREALRATYEHSSAPAVLVSDIAMPGMGGIELAARLSVERPGVAVVLMTADPASAEEARRHPELVTAVLVKPFAIEELVAAVDDALAPR